MKISDACNHKKSLSFEIFPPKKDSELKNIDATLDVLCELQPDFISVTFGAGGSLNCNRTIELAKKIKQNYHVEPVVHLTCLHYNRAEIDEFARILTAEGIQNVLALRGDRNPDLTEKDDFKHASDLISYLKPKGDFCFLGACYPECHPESANKIEEIRHLKEKVNAGAEVLLSQLFFDTAGLRISMCQLFLASCLSSMPRRSSEWLRCAELLSRSVSRRSFINLKITRQLYLMRVCRMR